MSAPTDDFAAAVTDTASDIEAAVRTLKQDRDTWQAVAESYRAAFQGQTARLHELQDICVATQAELENERAANRRSQAKSDVSQTSIRDGGQRTTDGTDDAGEGSSLGTATIIQSSRVEVSWRPNSCFRRVEQLVSQRDYGTALKEVDQLLRGSLAAPARVDGLLLKVNILQKSEWLFDALAACSEALELCHRIEELQSYLPRVQYQRGICYWKLRMVKQARDSFSEICNDELLYARASELRDSCDDQLLLGRRPGFEAHRTVTEGLLDQLRDIPTEPKRRRSQRFRIHVSKAKRLSIPQRWISPRSKPVSGGAN